MKRNINQVNPTEHITDSAEALSQDQPHSMRVQSTL